MAFNFNWKPQDLSYQQYQFLSNPDEAFKNKANTKIAQEMLGFEGNDIDGAAGNATREAYNKQMPYYHDLYGTVSKAGSLDLKDPTAFYNDIHEAEAYNFTPQEAENELNADIQADEKQAAVQKQAQIKDIQGKITALEQRIAANKAKLNDWNANQIAAIEARKINRQDPTSIWRWKQDKDTLQKNRIDDQKRIEAQKALNEAKEKVINRYKLDATLKSAKADPYMTRDQKKAMLMTLNDAMRDAQIHNDTEYMDKVQGALDELNNASSYEDLENGLKENYLRIKGMIGKKGGPTKDQAVEMINKMLADGTYDPVFKNNPGLKEQLLNFTISNMPNKPASGWNDLLQSGN